jgi:hypothetical protein
MNYENRQQAIATSALAGSKANKFVAIQSDFISHMLIDHRFAHSNPPCGGRAEPGAHKKAAR